MNESMFEARYWRKIEGDAVKCGLCPKMCRIAESRSGLCRARYNKNGALFSRIYGEVSSIAVDPIEKKPLYHFHPDSKILSIGTVGCNFSCLFCQNYHISQNEYPTKFMDPMDVVKTAEEYGSRGIAYTYSEPMIWYEYVLDTAKMAREKNMYNVLVTNGFINRGPLEEIIPYIDAMNIDLKAFREDFYKDLCGGEIAPVKETVEFSFTESVHVELTNLIIPGKNDDIGEVEEMTEWISGLSREIPLHFSRYFPNNKLNVEPTPLNTLVEARNVAKRKLDYVYIGNAEVSGADDTVCPKCNELLISRRGYSTRICALTGGKCSNCGKTIYGVFD